MAFFCSPSLGKRRFAPVNVLAGLLVMGACQTIPVAENVSLTDRVMKVSVGSADKVEDYSQDFQYASGYDASAFLTAHHATITGDIDTAANRYTVALSSDPDSNRLLERSFRSLYLAGQIENASAIAATLNNMGTPISLGSEPAAAIAAQNRDWAGLEVVARNLTEDTDGVILGTLLEAWAFAFQGRADAGLSRLMELNNGSEPPEMLFSQVALMLDYLGKTDDAAEAARIASSRNSSDTDTAIIMAGVLARNNARAEAITLIEQKLNDYYSRQQLIMRLKSGRSSLLIKPSPDVILANASADVALIKGSSLISRITRLRLAVYLNASFDRAHFHLGRVLRQANMIEEAMQHHQRVRQSSPWYQPARVLLGLYHSGTKRDFDAAHAIFTAMIEADPTNPLPLRFAGNNARRHDRFEEAMVFYDKAIEQGGATSKLNFYRGIALENLDRSRDAEAAFRVSLDLDPDDAHVLNYFGYWLLVNDGDPAEALQMIRKAVESDPRNGFFMDSLGWGYFKLGRFNKAMAFLERAVTLEPSDPVIIDHLGDAYEKTGRLREAIFEWGRALYYADDTVDAAIIQGKIEKARALLQQ